MKNPLQLRNAVLVTALAAVAATAWATTEYSSALVSEPPETTIEAMAATAEPVAPSESLSSNETVVVPAAPVAAPIVEGNTVQAPITIEDRRLTLDQRLQALVMDKLSQADNISGKIGVESQDAVVTLTGYTATSGQANRAGRYAGSVEGVKYVQNDLRYRVGSSH